jgi:hypothetical protein
MPNRISPAPAGAESRLRTRKRRSDRSEILTSSSFTINLEERRQAKIDKSEQQREKRGRNS